VVLHVLKGNKVLEIAVLQRAKRGRRWHVEFDGRRMERFSEMVMAVEAVDYEVRKMGARVLASAGPGAPWRHEPAPSKLLSQLARPPGRRLRTIDAWRLIAADRLVARRTTG